MVEVFIIPCYNYLDKSEFENLWKLIFLLGVRVRQ